MHTQRLFVAIHIDAGDSLVRLLSSLAHQLRHERINWVKPQNMHLTLKFIGSTPSDKIPEIIQFLQNISLKHSGFELEFDRTGLFGSQYNPKVIWLGSSKAPDLLISLAKDMINGFDQIGYPADRQNFVPHLTLARIKQLADKHYFQRIIRQIPQQVYIRQAIHSFRLYESILQKNGPVYKLIQEFQFDGLKSD